MFHYRTEKTIANCSGDVSWPLESGDGKLSIASYSEVVKIPKSFIVASSGYAS